MQCSTPGCDCHGQVLQPRCHVGAGFKAEYERGVLHLLCYECGQRVADIAVKDAGGPPDA